MALMKRKDKQIETFPELATIFELVENDIKT